MKIRGTSGFGFTTSLSGDRVVSILDATLQRWKDSDKNILRCAIIDVAPGEVRIEVLVRSDSFASVEASMDQLAQLVTERISEEGSSTASPRGLELVPA